MRDVGVRELKVRASEIVRQVREKRTRYVITYRGRPVALLMPIEESETMVSASSERESSAIWDELSRLGEEIGRSWRSSRSSAELLSEMRR